MSDLIPYLRNIYYHTKHLAIAFEGKKVFVAGGDGFFGSWFVNYFNYLAEKKNVSVKCVGLSRRSNWYIDAPETYTDFHEREADFVINCAGPSSGGDDLKMLDVHGLGPINLFRHMKPEARGLQVSSGVASPFNTDTPPGPYARAKRIAEMGISLLSRNVQIVRPFAVIGPGMDIQRSHLAIPSFIRAKLAGKPLEVTNQSCFRSYAHITDAMVQMLHVLVKGDGKPYNVGSESVISLLDAARLVSEKVVVTDRTFTSNAASEFYVANLSRIFETFPHLVTEMDYSSEEAILDTVKHYTEEDAR